MADLNVWSGTGHLYKDAEFRTLATGKQLLSFDLAVNTGWGEYQKTLSIRVQQWGERGKKIVDYLKKGKAVAVSGTLSMNEWVGKDGAKRQQLALDTNSVQFLASGGEAQVNADADKISKIAADGSEIDNIPF